MGDLDDLKPDAVVLELFEGQVAHAGVLVVSDLVLDVRAGAVTTLELGGLAGLVGQDRLEAVTVTVCEGELRAGVRALAAHDHP